MSATNNPKVHDAKRSAALLSVLAAAGITALKIVTGLATGSLGMLSEAAHSGLDLMAAAITLFSVQVSDRPADDDHNYGHGKVENLSAFVETFLMLASCVWIVYEACRRIFGLDTVQVRISPWPIAVLLLSIAVDWSRSRQLMRVAQAHGSQALEADAVHFGTDVWSSAAVLCGLMATYAGEHFHQPWMQMADPVAALAVSAIILRVSWNLARRTADELLDRTPEETRRQIIAQVSSVDGVVSVDRVRVRRSGNKHFADLTLGMPRNLTFQRSEQLVFAATEAVHGVLPEADVVVHTIPVASLAESVFDRVRAVAARNNLAIHDVSVQEYDGALHVEQHLEVDETLLLRDAHEMVTKLETEMRREVPLIATILTHIESEPATIARPATLEHDRALEAKLRKVALGFPEILDIHDVLVTKTGERIQINCHCTLPDDLPMARVHQLITELEGRFKLESPEVARVLIHPEPATDNRR